MEFREDLIEGDMDKFESVMKSNTVVECKIIKLKSYINALKMQMNDLNNKITMEKALNINLAKEIDVNQSMELQTRNRIANLNESKQLTVKMCNELYEQVYLEKRRCEADKIAYDTSIKNQLAKWEEYQILYKKFPLAKKVDDASIEIRKIEIEKKKAEYELEQFLKKIQMREVLHERRLHIAEEILEEAKSLNDRLKRKKELLENRKSEQLQLLEDLKQQKNEIQSKVFKSTESWSISNMKRPGDLYERNLRENITRPNPDFKAGSNVKIELPQLVQLPLLLQSASPSRKIRRIDMIDTSLQRPSHLHFIKSKPARPQLATSMAIVGIRKTRTHSTNSSNQIEMGTVVEAASTSFDDNMFNSQPVRANNLSQNFSNEHLQVKQLVNPTVKLPGKDNLQGRTENENASLETNCNVETEDNPRVEDTNTNESNENLNYNKAQENIEEEDILEQRSSTVEQGIESPMDEGYLSQSQNMLSSQTTRPLNVTSNISESGPSTYNVRQFEYSEGRVQQNLNLESQKSKISTPSTMASVSSNALNQGESRYFVSGRHELPYESPVANTSNAGNVFKAPPSRSLTTSVPINNQPDKLFNAKGQQPKPTNFQVMQNQQKPNDEVPLQSEYFTSTANDCVMSSWAKSPSPPRGNTMISPPDTSFNNSYLNVLSPLQNRHEPDNPAQISGESSQMMNIFGATQIPTTDGGFSFTSKTPNTSSFFSMFK